MNKLELSIPSDLSNIPQAENFIEILINQYQLPEKLHGKISLSVIEAVNNAMLYGNKQNPSKMIKLTAVEGKQKIVITVEDEGEGFDFEHIPDPTTPENLMKISGRGLYLMVSLTDELLFAKNGAKVVMTFFLN